ncbi:MAG TPA: SRPBCC family protein [Caulobacteraceae bacterium]|jgi:hypothetical protein|nr:SRPBCC family protein [Caulobacteraceae bacterium]
MTHTIFAAIAAAALFAGSALAWSPSAGQERDLQVGKAVAEVVAAPHGAAMIHGAIDIDAPARAIWQVMTDCQRVPRMITNLASCRVLERNPDGRSLVRETVTRGSPFIGPIRNVVREDYEPYSRIRFARVGGDLRIEQGQWVLQPLAGGATRVIYDNLVAADIAAPAALVRMGIRHDTAKVLENLRRECGPPRA